MYHRIFPTFLAVHEHFVSHQNDIISLWVASPSVDEILRRHAIEPDYFSEHFALHVFRYFMQVIRSEVMIGDCPVMGRLLEYFKDRDVSAQELFVICTHFRKAMLSFAGSLESSNGLLAEEIIDLFDQNFAGVLKRYTDTIFQKELEIARNVKLLDEYKRAIDESAIVAKTDTSGTITYVNDNFCTRSHYSREELLGLRCEALWDDPSSVEEIRSCMGRGEIFHDTVALYKKSGERCYVDMTMLPIYTFDGSVGEYMQISYEVTSLIEATRAAVAAGEAKEHFLSNMSHEIRTPLNAILGFVALLQEEVSSERHRQFLNIISNSGENLLSIINDILDFSKLQNGEFTIEPRPFNIHEQLSKTLEIFVPAAQEREITLLSYFDPSIPHILHADILRLKQIVSNFISNAIKFSHPYAHVEVRVSCRDAHLNIDVRDWGIGLKAEDIERIFDPFSQVHASMDRIYGGTGLGLSICKKLAERMGGSIKVASRLGEGSTFSLELPVGVGEYSSQYLFDPTPFRSLRIGVISLRGVQSKMLDSLNYYFDFFGFERRVIAPHEVQGYGLLLFVDEETTPHILALLRSYGMPMIAIMKHLSDRFDQDPQITPLFCPIYCAKIYNAFLSAFHRSKADDGHRTLTAHRRFSGHLLVAEDNEANQELIRAMLERYGLSCRIVSNGDDAVRAYEREDFDLVLMDEQMPLKNGLEAMREMKALHLRSDGAHAPIVALTANVIKGAKERALMAGYDAFLGKPVVAKEMERIFDLYLKQEPSSAPFCLAVQPSDERIDYADLCETLQLEADAIQTLLEVYARKMRDTLPKLEAATAQCDYKAVAKLAHTLRGSSANFRFEEVVQLLGVIEESAAAGDTQFAYEEAIAVLRERFEALGL
ncbi:MAG: response regulator [Campylobacterales bacterium]|nr:response regulator [Campylobacterales bacterium]